MTQANDTNITAATPVRKPTLNWRFEFESYAKTREFLDKLADFSKLENFYPNLNFAKTYVNVSIDDDGQTELGAREDAFVAEMKALAAQGPT